MAGIATAIQLTDQMTGPLNSMASALYMTIGAFEEMQSACDSSFDTSTFTAARDELDKVAMAVNEIEFQVNQAEQQQQKFNKALQDGAGYADNLSGKIGNFVSLYALLNTGKKAFSWVEESLGFADTQLNAERQLAVVLRNVGAAEDAMERLQNKASEIQGYSMYGDEAMLGGAAELATYISDVGAIEHMLDTLANYSAGMSGGGEVGFQEMVNYATQLGKALDGTYDGLTKKGFELTDAQKKIIENGTDMEKALVIDDVINQSWAGLAESMAEMPFGIVQQFKNDWGDIREEIGARLYPAVIGLINTLNQNMPQVETVMYGLASAIQLIVFAITQVIDVASAMYNFISENWSLIAPVVMGIVGAVLAYNAVLLAHNIIQGVTNGLKTLAAIASVAHGSMTLAEAAATTTMTKAQISFNAALYASPITWIVIIIIALIAVIYMAVAAVNKFAGTSVSATGIICGVFMVAMAFIGNLVIGTINSMIQFIWTLFVEPFIGIIEWVLNVANGGFDSFGGAVSNLIGQIISWFLSLGKVVTKIIDAIFGTDWTSGLSALQNEVTQWGKNEDGITLSREAPEIDHRFNYGDAWDIGYEFGEGIDDKFKSFSTDSLFDELNYDYEMDGFGDIPDYSEITADNTGAMKNSLEITSEDLKYLKDLAEAEAINRFTTAEIKLDITNNNNINNAANIDGIVEALTEEVAEALIMSAAGVHI